MTPRGAVAAFELESRDEPTDQYMDPLGLACQTEGKLQSTRGRSS